MREVRIADLTLVSTLLDANDLSKFELFDPTRRRWQIELDFRSIKTVMQRGILRCKSSEMIRKKIAVLQFIYSHCANCQNPSALGIGELARRRYD
jgi:hypothetical protein